MSCLGDCADVFGQFNNCNMKLVNGTHRLIDEIKNGEMSPWNYLWVFPLNLGASLIGIALAPVAILLNLISAAIFKIYNCIAGDNENGLPSGFLILSAAQIDLVCNAIFRIFFPAGKDAAPLSECIAKCLLEQPSPIIAIE